MEKTKLQVVPDLGITPARILEVAKRECSVWQELELLPLGVRGVFAAFAGSITALSLATKEDAVVQAINAVGDYCMRQSAPIEELSNEAARRKEWLNRLSEIQDMFEEKRGEAETAFTDVSQQIKYDKSTPEMEREKILLNKKMMRFHNHITALVGLRDLVQSELNILEQYLRSLETLNKGYPAKLVKAELPAIPEFVEESDSMQTLAEVAVPVPAIPAEEGRPEAILPDPIRKRLTRAEKSALAAGVPVTARRRELQEIAEHHGFLEVEVLVYCLYDFFGTGNSLFGKMATHRSNSRVVTTCLEMIPEFGWKNCIEFFADSGWRKDRVISQGYLKHRGNNRMYDMWVRSEKPLPWNPRSLFSENEIADFVGRMKKPVPKRQKIN